jgi:hypothetical protein
MDDRQPTPRWSRADGALRLASLGMALAMALVIFRFSGAASSRRLAASPSTSPASPFKAPAAWSQGFGAVVAAQTEPPVARLHLPWLAKGVARGARLEDVTQWGGSARAVVLDGERVWLGVGAQVWAVEASALAGGDLASAVIGTSEPLPGLVFGLALDASRQRLHVALRTAGNVEGVQPVAPKPSGILLTLDVSAPERPRIVARHPLEDGAAVALDGDRLVVTAEREGREGPVDPAGGETPVAPADEPPPWTGLQVFALDESGLPEPRGRLALSDARGLVLRAGMAYTCDPAAGILSVVDLSDPDRPRDAGLVSDLPCVALAAADTVLVALTSPDDGVPALTVLDDEDPSRPQRLATLALHGEAWGDVPRSESIHRARALAVDADMGVAWVAGQDPRPWRRRVDLSTPAEPRPAHAAYEPLLGLAIDAAAGRVALAGALGDADGMAAELLARREASHLEILRAPGALALYEREAPAEGGATAEQGRWRTLGTLRTPSHWIVEAAVDPASATAYLLEAWSRSGVYHLGLWVADLGVDPPRLQRRIDLPAELRTLAELDRWQLDMVVLGEHVAITAAGTTWIVGTREGAGVTRATTGAVALASDGLTLFSAGDGALIPWRIDDAAGLQPIGPALSVPDHPWLRLAATPGHLWRSAAPDRLAHLDTQEPGAPVEDGRIALAGEGVVLAARGERVVTLDRDGRLLLFEAPAPGEPEDRTPVLLAGHRIPEVLRPAAALAFDGGHAWWPVASGGVAGLDLERPREPAFLVASSQGAAARMLAAAAVYAEPGEVEEINPWQAARVAVSGDRVLLTRFGAGARVLRVVGAAVTAAELR